MITIITVVVVIVNIIIIMVQGFPDYFALVGLGNQHKGGGTYNRNATLDDR